MTFSRTSTEHTVVVNIVDDDLLEMDEVFTAMLEFVDGSDAARVMLEPAQASVTIMDNDSEYMEARELMYLTHEVALSLATKGC